MSDEFDALHPKSEDDEEDIDPVVVIEEAIPKKWLPPTRRSNRTRTLPEFHPLMMRAARTDNILKSNIVIELLKDNAVDDLQDLTPKGFKTA